MTDNRLRCALVYRLSNYDVELTSGGHSTSAFGGADDDTVDGGITLSDISLPSSSNTAVPTLLVKYDHASLYESHGGIPSEDCVLYGGRDKSYADAVSMVLKNDPPRGPSSGEDSGLGRFKVIQSATHQVVYGSDHEGLCVAVITGLKYPSRVAIQMLIELHSQFVAKFGVQLQFATKSSLSKKAKPLLSSLCQQYDDATKVDKATTLLGKVEEVKSSMQDNIAALLANTEKTESIAQQSEQLNEQAAVFKKRSQDLKKQMRCKNLKVTIILVVIVVGVLLAIFLPLILRSKAVVSGQ